MAHIYHKKGTHHSWNGVLHWDNHNTLIGRTMDNNHIREGVVTLLLGPTMMIPVAEYIRMDPEDSISLVVDDDGDRV